MKYEFSAEWVIHKGDSKYYQVIAIRKEGASRGVVITHWGKTHPGAPSEPKHHGQCKVDFKEAGIISARQQAIANKKKRGYENWTVRKQDSGLSELELRAAINGWFKTTDAAEIMNFMFNDPLADENEDGDELAVRISTPTITEITKKDWGSW